MPNIDFPLDRFNFNSDNIYEGLTENDLKILNSNKTTLTYKKGEILFRAGSHPTGVYQIEKGKIKKYKTNNEGNEQIIYIYRDGDIFGYHALLCNEKYSVTVSTIEESVISFIPKEDFLKILSNSTQLSNRLLKIMSHEFGVLINVMEVMVQKTARERLALGLLLLKDKFKTDEAENEPVIIDLSRDDLSKFVCTARETLIRLLHDLKEEGVIEIKGRKIILLNPAAISAIANLDF